MSIYAQLSCAMPRDSRMMAAGWQARAVYVEAMLYCRENLTDGVIDRLTVPCWMPDMPTKIRFKYLDQLLTVGALEAHEQGWRFPEPVWRKWNPLKSEVEAKREAEAKRKADYRARKNGETQASTDVPTGQAVYATHPSKQPEPEPKEEPEPKRRTTPSTLLRPAPAGMGELISGMFQRIEDVA
jgi:hypothetical protein